MEKPTITHSLIISGKVKDVCEQLKQMSIQFPNATIKEMLDAYQVKEMILR
jgi:hypothetical protein